MHQQTYEFALYVWYTVIKMLDTVLQKTETITKKQIKVPYVNV